MDVAEMSTGAAVVTTGAAISSAGTSTSRSIPKAMDMTMAHTVIPTAAVNAVLMNCLSLRYPHRHQDATMGRWHHCCLGLGLCGFSGCSDELHLEGATLLELELCLVIVIDLAITVIEQCHG